MSENKLATSSASRHWWPAWLNGFRGVLAAATALYLLVYLAWIGFHWGGPENVTLIGDLVNLPLDLLAVLAAWRIAADKNLGPRLRRAWFLLGLGLFSYFIGDAIWAYLENILQAQPFPALSDVFYLGFYPLILWGLVTLPTAQLNRRERLTFWLDLLVVLVAAALSIGYFLITPTAEVNSNDLLTQITAVAYPIGDLVLFVGLIAVLFRRPDPDTRSAFSIFLVGLAFFILSDLAFGYTSLAGTYLTGSWVDAGWNVAMGFIILAVLRQLHRASASVAEPRWTRLADRFAEALPLVALAASYGLLIYVTAVDTIQTSWWILSGAALLTALVIVRQIARASFGNLSLRAKLIIAFVGVTAISVTALAFATNRIVRAQLTAQVGATMKSLANEQAVTVGDVLAKHADALQALALNKPLQDAVMAANAAATDDQAEIDKLDQQWRAADDADNDADPLVQSVLNNAIASELRIYRDTFPENVEFFVTNQHGVNVAATNRTSDYYQADEAWWQEAYNGGQGAVFIGQPAINESSRTFSINIAAPVYAHDTREVIGVLHTILDHQVLIDVIALGGRAEILLPSGYVLRSEGDIEEFEPDLLAQIESSANAGYGIFVYEDVPSIVGQATVRSTDPEEGEAIAQLGWTVLVAQDDAEALQPVTTAARTAFLTSFGVLIMAGLAASGMAQLLTQPIIRLTAVAAQIAEGDLAAQAQVESRDEIGTLASTFNNMAAQLRDTLAGLERRVADRTRALAISAEVSRRLSTLLDQQQLVSEVVEQLQTAFNYYHVHIYLWDEKRENLVMVGGTGEAGRIMLGRGHQIPKGRGLVGRAADTNLTVLVTDVSKEAGWLPNPLLPETKAEVAVPIALGERVLGVLDVQHNMVSGLRQEDAELIQSVANQVAIGLQNIRAYVEAQQQAQREALAGAIGQKIQSAANVETAMQIAVREVGRALGGARVGVRLKAGGPTNGHGHESPNTEEVR